MKIGVSSYSFRQLLKKGMTYFEACDHAKRMGYDGIEFIDLNLAYGGGESTPEALADAIRRHCEALNLPIAAYTVEADFVCGRGGGAQDEPNRVMRCADIAAILGAKVMRHDAFWSLDALKGWREAVEQIAPGIRTVAQYAQTLGIRTCVENHGLIMQDSDRVETLIRTVNHENFGWLVDMGNFLCADEAPEHAVGIAAPYAVHAHVKDFLFKPGTVQKPAGAWLTTRAGNYLRGTVAGDGIVPIAQCAGILKRAGYDGFLSVEFEGAEETLPALENALAYLRACGL